MKDANSLILRISGAIFLVMAIIAVIEMLGLIFGAFGFFTSGYPLSWKAYFLFLAIVFAFHVLTSLLSCCTALIFGGKREYVQAEWNLSVYSLVSISLYVSAYFIGMMIDGNAAIPEDLQFTYLSLIMARAAFALIVLTCCKREDGFSWKNILPFDAHSKLCLKLTAGLGIAVFIGCAVFMKTQL